MLLELDGVKSFFYSKQMQPHHQLQLHRLCTILAYFFYFSLLLPLFFFSFCLCCVVLLVLGFSSIRGFIAVRRAVWCVSRFVTISLCKQWKLSSSNLRKWRKLHNGASIASAFGTVNQLIWTDNIYLKKYFDLRDIIKRLLSEKSWSEILCNYWIKQKVSHTMDVTDRSATSTFKRVSKTSK